MVGRGSGRGAPSWAETGSPEPELPSRLITPEAIELVSQLINEYGRDPILAMLEVNPSTFTPSTGVDARGNNNPRSPLGPPSGVTVAGGGRPASYSMQPGQRPARTRPSRWDSGTPVRIPGSESGVARPPRSSMGGLGGGARRAAAGDGNSTGDGAWATPEPSIGGAGEAGRGLSAGGPRFSVPQPRFDGLQGSFVPESTADPGGFGGGISPSRALRPCTGVGGEGGGKKNLWGGERQADAAMQWALAGRRFPRFGGG